MKPPQAVPSPICWPLFHQGWIICSLATSTACVSLWVQPVLSQRDMGTKELHGWTSGHPLELAPSTMSSVLPGRGCALEMVLVAASLSCPMEALLEAEQGVYFYPGIGVFIASSCCSNEHCRNTLWEVLPVCWSPSGLHMHAHTCMGVDTGTPPPGYPFSASQSPHTAGKSVMGQ